MKKILEIQSIDGEIVKIKSQLAQGAEQKQIKDLSTFMRDGRSFIDKTNNYAAGLINEYNELKAKYAQLQEKSENLQKSKVEQIEENDVENSITEINAIASEMGKMDVALKNLFDNISRLLQDYNNAMNKLRVAKEKMLVAKNIASEKETSVAPQINELQAKIDALKPEVDSKMWEDYSRMREDNIYPVYVNSADNRCGGCHMELSLNFIEKLKDKKLLQCEECHRYILV